MKKVAYSITLYWDSRVMDTKTKLSKIMLTVNRKSGQYRLSLPLRSTKSDFEKAYSSSRVTTDAIRDLKREMNEYVLKAENIFKRQPSIDWELFKRLYKSATDLYSSNSTDLFNFYQLKMDEATSNESRGNYSYYKQCRDNLKKFKGVVSVEDVDAAFIKKYELYLKGTLGNSPATVALRMRALKIVMNVAAKQGFVSDVKLIFEKVQLGSSVRSKSVLYPPELKKLWEYTPVTLREKRAKATFFFLYLSNGMNPKDMAYLRWTCIRKDSFSFVREKTKNTRKSAQEITVYLSDDLKKIIAEWGTNYKQPFVFPIVKGKDFIERERSRCTHQRICNKSLSKMGEKLGFEVHLCLNLARHSFATMHKISGTPVSFISEAMGHANSAMTENYMKSLPTENRRVMSEKLLAFDCE